MDSDDLQIEIDSVYTVLSAEEATLDLLKTKPKKSSANLRTQANLENDISDWQEKLQNLLDAVDKVTTTVKNIGNSVVGCFNSIGNAFE